MLFRSGDNGDATFLTINPLKYILPLIDPVVRDYDWYIGGISPLEKVVLSEE